MTPEMLDRLLHVSQAVQDADAAKLKTIQVAEQKIRAQLTALDAGRESGQNLPAETTFPQRRLGGDVLWQVWVGRRKRELQIQLARVLAQKGIARRDLQKSFGKRYALAQVKEEAQRRTYALRRNAAHEKMLALGLLQDP